MNKIIVVGSNLNLINLDCSLKNVIAIKFSFMIDPETSPIVILRSFNKMLRI